MAAPRTTTPHGDALTAAILRHLRAAPNQERDLAGLAADLSIDPTQLQLAVERLHQRRLLIVPFVEPGQAGGAKLTGGGLRWLVNREGGVPHDTPIALKPATSRVRAEAEAARLPRAEVYGVHR